MAFGAKMHTCLRVAVIDDDVNTRLFFQDVLQTSPQFDFAGGFSSAAEALAEIPRIKPDLTLMDLRLPDLNGVECTKRLKQIMPGLRIIIVTGTHHENWVGASLQAGAAAYLLKPIFGDQLLATLQFSAVGLSRNDCVSNGASLDFVISKPLTINLPLTSRERAVLKNLARGLLYKEISRNPRC